MNYCDGCLAWSYKGSNFSRPEGERMEGWCRVWSKETNQSYSCEHFSSRSEQEKAYRQSLKRDKGE